MTPRTCGMARAGRCAGCGRKSRRRDRPVDPRAPRSPLTRRRRSSLTPKQALFVREYLVDYNGTQAAVRAGYSERTAGSQAHRLLRNVEIVQEIQQAVNAQAKRLDVTADRVVQELARIAFADIREVVTVEPTRTIDGEVVEGGVRALPSDNWSEDAAASVAEVAETSHGLRIRMHSKSRALELLAQHLGIVQRCRSSLTRDPTASISAGRAGIGGFEGSPPEKRPESASNARRVHAASMWAVSPSEAVQMSSVLIPRFTSRESGILPRPPAALVTVGCPKQPR